MITAREVFDRATALFLAKDLTGFADLFAADGAHELPFAPAGMPTRIEGREPIRAYLSAVGDVPLTHTEFRNLTVYSDDADTLIAEYDAYGTVAGTGRTYTIRYVQVLHVRDGEITLWRDYWNPNNARDLLG